MASSSDRLECVLTEAGLGREALTCPLVVEGRQTAWFWSSRILPPAIEIEIHLFRNSGLSLSRSPSLGSTARWTETSVLALWPPALPCSAVPFSGSPWGGAATCGVNGLPYGWIPTLSCLTLDLGTTERRLLPEPLGMCNWEAAIINVLFFFFLF